MIGDDNTASIVHDLEHEINDLEARCRFYEKLIVRLGRDEELSIGQFVTLIQLLDKYSENKIKRVSRKDIK